MKRLIVLLVVGGAVPGTHPVNSGTFEAYSSSTRNGQIQVGSTLDATSTEQIVLTEATAAREGRSSSQGPRR